MKSIQCLNFRCRKEYSIHDITLHTGFDCPSCGYNDYSIIEIILPKKRKDKIKFIKEYDEKYNR